MKHSEPLLEKARGVSDLIRDQTSIALDRSTKELLDELKLVSQESYNSLLKRLLEELGEAREKRIAPSAPAGGA